MLRWWLPLIVQNVEYWISKRDIKPGDRWALVLGQALEDSDFGIICLTRDNLSSPWLLFEAGAMSRGRDTKVVPVRFGLATSDIQDPLKQFQSVNADRDGIEDLVGRLFDVSRSKLDAPQRETVFTQLWPLLESRIAELSTQSQAQRPLESAIDLVDALTASLQPGHPPMALDWESLGRLRDEVTRLRDSLDHLEVVEATFSPDRVPGGLADAMASMEFRLQLTTATVGSALARIAATLTPSQVAALKRLMTPDGARILRTIDDYPSAADKETLAQLSAAGLIAVNQDGTVVIHPLVAAELGSRLQAR
jgi:hypothetical protein